MEFICSRQQPKLTVIEVRIHWQRKSKFQGSKNPKHGNVSNEMSLFTAHTPDCFVQWQSFKGIIQKAIRQLGCSISKCWFLFLKNTISQQTENRNAVPRTKQSVRASYNTWAVPSQIHGFISVVSVLSTSHELINIDGSSFLTIQIFLQYLTEWGDVVGNT